MKLSRPNFSTKSHGFTLIEVLLAIIITAFSLTNLFLLQTHLLNRMGQRIATWHVVTDLNNFYLEQEQKKIKPTEKDILLKKNSNDVHITYHLTMPHERSAFKDIHNFRLVKELAIWHFFGFESSSTLTGARLVPEEIPKEEEKGKL